jgi:hypothetical protein
MNIDLLIIGIVALGPGLALLVGGLLTRPNFTGAERLVITMGGGSMAALGALLIAAAIVGAARSTLEISAAAVIAIGVIGQWAARRSRRI